MYTFSWVLLILCSAIYRTSGATCLLMETSRNPWVVKIWKPDSAKIVGHGALLSEDKVLSSCNAYANLSADLANERYEMIVDDYGGVDRQISFCTDSRFANSITIHPECDPSSSSQLHDFAMWILESPFKVVGKPFLTSLLREKEAIEIHISEIGLNEACEMVYAKVSSKRGLLGSEQIVSRCGFQDYSTLDVCKSENCTQQLADGLLCFYNENNPTSDSWKVRKPLEAPDFVEGSVVLCFGNPVGIASRTFYSNYFEVYRMFSNFANNLDFLNVSLAISTTQMTSPSTNGTGATTKTDSGRKADTIVATRLTTPINCKCSSYNKSVYNFDGQISIHGDQFWYILTALGIQAILQIFGTT